MHCSRDRTADFAALIASKAPPRAIVGQSSGGPAGDLLRALHDAVGRTLGTLHVADDRHRAHCAGVVETLRTRALNDVDGLLNLHSSAHCQALLAIYDARRRAAQRRRDQVGLPRHYTIDDLPSQAAEPTAAHRRARTQCFERYEMARNMLAIERRLVSTADAIESVATLVQQQDVSLARLESNVDSIETRVHSSRRELQRVLERRGSRVSRLTKLRCALAGAATLFLLVLLAL